MEEDTFSSPVCERESAELRRFIVIFGIIQADFSALQTVWRRGGDSNPRYPLRYVRFRGGSFQPLTHLSAPDSYSIGGVFYVLIVRFFTSDTSHSAVKVPTRRNGVQIFSQLTTLFTAA